MESQTTDRTSGGSSKSSGKSRPHERLTLRGDIAPGMANCFASVINLSSNNEFRSFMLSAVGAGTLCEFERNFRDLVIKRFSRRYPKSVPGSSTETSSGNTDGIAESQLSSSQQSWYSYRGPTSISTSSSAAAAREETPSSQDLWHFSSRSQITTTTYAAEPTIQPSPVISTSIVESDETVFLMPVLPLTTSMATDPNCTSDYGIPAKKLRLLGQTDFSSGDYWQYPSSSMSERVLQFEEL